ncbi:hypothetical protein BKH43_08155 [Helicobacter sp. 13S00401-1]|uniref:hypothetical protein n=1 Tax=Helicobacter sp. 13S00401-1 TaxID=1905758 RepID=UPI000BA73096|nr:hypothetical protein [Helicobacter sp. 13S00401-1]PAF47612.1 hypothetical protein BKH43_08155 [Helicobacter sp. 13S00401-1]
MGGNATITTLSQAVDSNIQQLQDAISALSPASVSLANASKEQADRLQNGYNSYNSALNDGNTGLLIKKNVVSDTNGHIKYNGQAAANLWGFVSTGANSLVNAINNYDSLASKASSFNNVVNGNTTLTTGPSGTVPNNGINTNSQLYTTMSNLRQSVVNLQNALTIPTQVSNNPQVLEAKNAQLASLSQLNATIDALQSAVNINSANVVSANKASLQALANPPTTGSTRASWTPSAAVNEDAWWVGSGRYDSTGNPDQTDDNSGKAYIKDQLAGLINNSNNRGVVPLLQSTQNAATSASSIEGIINGGNNPTQAVTYDTVKTVVNTTPTGTTTTVTTYANGDPSKPNTPTVTVDNTNKLDPSKTTATEVTNVSYAQVARPLQDSNGANVKSLNEAIKDVRAANEKLEQAVSAAVIAQNQAAGAAAREGARRNSAPTILPTAKAGLIAFFGKHQSVSVEYQYYFRNTNPSFTSGEVTLNYAYYFGGK